MNSSFVGNSFIAKSVEQIIKKYSSAAFLFSGTEGIGKNKLSRILVNNLLNEKKDSRKHDLLSDDYKYSKSYKFFKSKTHPDFFFIENTNNKITIDQTRKLKKFLITTSSYSSCKCIIIDSVNNLTINAINTLLKSVEEPSINTYFFFITHNNSQIINTLKSRLFNFNFKPLTRVEFSEVLSRFNLKGLDEKKILFLGSLFNYSPGLCKKFYDLNFFENYKNILVFLLKNFDKKKPFETFNFIQEKENDYEIELKIFFINRIVKIFTLYNLSNKLAEDFECYEIDFLQNVKYLNVRIILNIYNQFQNELYLANKLNVNKDILIDNFFKSLKFLT